MKFGIRFIFISCVFIIFMTSCDSMNTNITEKTELVWDKNNITVYKPSSGGVWYPRLVKLENGDLLAAFDTNEDGGRTSVKIVRSEDNGLTWQKAIKATDFREYDCANGQFLQLRSGEIWLAYRANVQKGDKYYSSIRINSSKDDGKTWQFTSIAEEEEGKGGVYEPHLGYIGDKVAVFYANDSLNVVKSNSQQNIEFKVWDGSDWSEKYIACDGIKANSREGMPVWDKMEDGRYILIFEATDKKSYPFVIRYKISDDGYNWSTKRYMLYIPKETGKKAGAPYIVKLKDGRLAASFQTDEDASRNGDDASIMKILISKDKNGDKWSETFIPFEIPNGRAACWNGMYVDDDTLIAITSSNYPAAGIYLRRAAIKSFE